MFHRLMAAVFAVSLCVAAETTLTVDQLRSFLQSSVQLKQTDRQVASFLSKVKMAERLEERTIEDMQSLEIGPRTLEALHALSEQSKSLASPKARPPEVKPIPIPPPSSEEQARIIQEVREGALNYSKSLPDFICTQVTRRYFDPSGLEYWQLGDTLTIRLSYFEQKEDYKLILVNNTVSNQAYESLGGATSSGEFGSMLRDIFEPSTETRFEWDHWATLRKRRALAFSYHVAQSRSQWHVNFERRIDIVPAYQGMIYVDRETHQVLRVTLEAVDMPATFPIQEVKTVLDYDFINISEREFILPLKAETRMRSGKFLTRNDVEFRLYRKFSAEAEIKYDTPAPLPEDLTTEQAPK